MFQDKIYEKLQNNEVRERILNKKLQENECDNKEVFEFLSLLENPARKDTTTFHPISEED